MESLISSREKVWSVQMESVTPGELFSLQTFSIFIHSMKVAEKLKVKRIYLHFIDSLFAHIRHVTMERLFIFEASKTRMSLDTIEFFMPNITRITPRNWNTCHREKEKKVLCFYFHSAGWRIFSWNDLWDLRRLIIKVFGVAFVTGWYSEALRSSLEKGCSSRRKISTVHMDMCETRRELEMKTWNFPNDYLLNFETTFKTHKFQWLLKICFREARRKRQT